MITYVVCQLLFAPVCFVTLIARRLDMSSVSPGDLNFSLSPNIKGPRRDPFQKHCTKLYSRQFTLIANSILFSCQR